MTSDFETLIVGAGLCGLTIAAQLNPKKTLVLEKSRGLGGRMATRRSNDAVFDHGTQVYKVDSDIQHLHQLWSENSDNLPVGDFFAGRGGMTTLAKRLAQNLNLEREQKVVNLKQQDLGWEVTCDTGRFFLCKQLILTAPLPQALELLNVSGIPYDAELRSLTYHPALVGLFSCSKQTLETLNSHSAYEKSQELSTNGIASWSWSDKKGISPTPALTVVMNETFSESQYSKTDDESLSLIERAVLQREPKIEIVQKELKRWRYSHPRHAPTKGMLYATVSHEPLLILAGDAFGGGSLNGAVRSGTAVLNLAKSIGRP